MPAQNIILTVLYHWLMSNLGGALPVSSSCGRASGDVERGLDEPRVNIPLMEKEGERRKNEESKERKKKGEGYWKEEWYVCVYTHSDQGVASGLVSQ